MAMWRSIMLLMVLCATVLLCQGQLPATPPVVGDAGAPFSLDAVCLAATNRGCQLWRASSAAAELTLPASVPGDLISDLHMSGIIGDPWFETTFLDNSSVWQLPDWSYTRNFSLPTRVSGAPHECCWC
jgi:hypothetical protein